MSYTERNYSLNKTDPWNIDSDYDLVTDRDEDTDGDGQLDSGETDPGRGLAAVPFEPRRPIYFHSEAFGSGAHSAVKKPSPPVNARYDIMFYFDDLDWDDMHWEAPLCLSKGHGESYPVIEIDPPEAASTQEESNPTAAARGLKFVRIRTTDSAITDFKVDIKEPGGALIYSYKIMLHEPDFIRWQEITGETESQYSSLQGPLQYTSGAKSPGTMALTDTGGEMPAVGIGDGIWDSERGEYFIGKNEEIGEDPTQLLALLHYKEVANALWMKVKSEAHNMSQGDFTIFPRGGNAIAQSILLSGMKYSYGILLNLFFRFGIKPLEFWMVWIQHWRYQVNLEAPEEFLSLSYGYIDNLMDFGAVNQALNDIEEQRNWRNILGEPTHFYLDSINVAVPANEVDAPGPGWAEVPVPSPEEQEDPMGLSSLSNKFEVLAANGLRGGPDNTSIQTAAVTEPGELYKLLKANTKTPYARAAEILAQITSLVGIECAAIKAIFAYTVQYSGGKGQDFIFHGQDGYIYRAEVKSAEKAAELGILRRTGRIQQGPAWMLTSDLNYFRYGDSGIGNKVLSPGERYEELIMKLNNAPAEHKAHYEAIKKYYDGVLDRSENGMRAWLKTKSLGQVKKYLPKAGISSLNDLDNIADSHLFDIFDKEASLYFDFLAEKFLAHFMAELKYFSKVKVIIFLNKKNGRMACEGIKMLSEEWTACMNKLFNKKRLSELSINLEEMGIKLSKIGDVILTNYKEMKQLKKLMNAIF